MRQWLKTRILRITDLENIHDRVNKLEDRQEELTGLERKLTDKLMEGRPQLRHILNLLEDNHLTKPEIVQELTDTFDISQTTAYRRVNELENELQYIEKNEKGYTKLVEH
jgi:hypothetical protein